MPSKEELKMFQAYPLDMKIAKTKLRIREWVDYYGVDGVYVSFSGGKDSTVLLPFVKCIPILKRYSSIRDLNIPKYSRL